jgi:hypothetical protein
MMAATSPWLPPSLKSMRIGLVSSPPSASHSANSSLARSGSYSQYSQMSAL